MTIDDWNDEIKAEVPKMFEQGIPSFKMYMTYPAMMIGDKDLFYALEEIKKYGGIAGVHCENAGVIDALIEQHKADGKLAPGSHPECRPNATEAEAVAHLLRICEVADTPVVIVHLSTKEALAEVMAARARGQKVYVETCPHYLTLDESGYYEADFRKAAGYICAPPLRTKDDQNALWKGLYNGAIQYCLDRPLQLYARAEGSRQGRLHEDSRRPSRCRDKGRAALYLRRGNGQNHEREDGRGSE